MRKHSADQNSEAVKIQMTSLKVVHSTRHAEKAITRTIAGTPTMAPPAPYYPSSYSKDGPGGNYQGL